MRILLSNDDGIHAPGLAALHEILSAHHQVTVVAPDRAMSGGSHAVTIRHPVLWKHVRFNGQSEGVSVEGTPADCIKLAMNALLPEPPELVVSGINSGLNTGIHALYSGTVAAAMEGAILGRPAIAVSLQLSKTMEFSRAARIALKLIEEIVRQAPAPRQVFNINIPHLGNGAPKGVRVAPQSIRPTMDRIEKRTDPNGRAYYWLSGDFVEWDETTGTDIQSVREGYVSITPLQFNLTDATRLAEMQGWSWPELTGA